MKEFQKTKIKRAAGLFLAGMMIASTGAALTGCGKKEETSTLSSAENAETLKALAYKVSDMKIKSDIGDVYEHKGKFYSIAYQYDPETYFASYSIVVFGRDGVVEQNIPVYKQTDENSYGYINGGIKFAENGDFSILFVSSSYSFDPDGNENYEEKIEIKKFSADGQLISSSPLDQIVSQDENQDGLWFNSYVLDKDGNMICNLGSAIRVVGTDGKVLFTTPKMQSGQGWINGLILTNEGVPAVLIYDYSDVNTKVTLKEIDVNAKGYGKEYTINNGNINQAFSGVNDYLFIGSSDTGLVGYKADGTTETMINLINLGVDNSQINSFSVCDDGSFLISGYGNMGNKYINVIEPIDASEVKEKKVITLGCFYLSWELRSTIAEFNKNSDEYLINVQSYSDTNDITDYDAATTKFNNELIAGNVPDILLVDSSMPFDSYVAKGLFADLYPVIEKDGAYTKDDFMPNVLKALERDGKLYEMPVSFNVSAFAGKRKNIPDPSSFGLEEAKKATAALGPDAQLLGGNYTKQDIISRSLSGFVDYKNAKSSFDSPEFKAVLEAANEYPAEIDWDKLYEDPSYWEGQETVVADDKALLTELWLYDFDSLTRYEKVTIQDEMSCVGFPFSAGNAGPELNLNTVLAISSKCKDTQGAWSFIKEVLESSLTENKAYPFNGPASSGFEVGSSVLDDEGQQEIEKELIRYYSNGGLPVLVSKMDILAEQATRPQYYKDENGQLVEQDNTWWINNEEIKLPLPTKADVDKYLDIIKSADRVAFYDKEIAAIVTEDCEAYFNGTKSADETAATIQSRVSIYLSEQYS